MTCHDCEASRRALWHGFKAECMGCKARAVARSPQFSECRKSGKQALAYRALLSKVGVTHEQVKAAFAADALSGVAA